VSKSDKQAKAPLDDAESLAAANAEIQAEIEARAPVDEGSVVIVNLQVNPMKVLGLAGLHSEATLTALQMADPRFAAKVERAKSLGLIMVK
jgi:hypothetical protein